MRIGIATINEAGTTAWYFEIAAIAAGHDVRVLTSLERPSALDSLDVLIVVDPFLKSPGVLRGARCPVAGYLIDVHQDLLTRRAYARYFDHVFVAQPDYLHHFKSLPHASAHWLPLACDRGVHFAPGQQRIHDVGFVGKLGYPDSERRATLEHVLARFSTNDYQRYHTPREMGEVYSRSKIVFNKSINGDLNMRFFEGLAAGALVVTDRIGNGLDRVGRDGIHFVTYTSIEEAVDKIRYFLAHDAKREAIAVEGQRHVFAHHTYGHRLATMLEVLASAKGQPAPARVAPARTEAIWRSECMMRQGAQPLAVGKLLLEGNVSGWLLRNAATAAARGVVRPLRQAAARMNCK